MVCISSGVAYPLSDSGIMHFYEWNVISNKNFELHNGLHHSDLSGWSFVLNMSGHIIVTTDLMVPRNLINMPGISKHNKAFTKPKSLISMAKNMSKKNATMYIFFKDKYLKSLPQSDFLHGGHKIWHG